MTRHTNSPWTVIDNNIRCEADLMNSGTFIAVMDSTRSPQETQANARLIAKAPELLRALRECIAAGDASVRSTNDVDAMLRFGAADADARALLAEIDGGTE